MTTENIYFVNDVTMLLLNKEKTNAKMNELCDKAIRETRKIKDIDSLINLSLVMDFGISFIEADKLISRIYSISRNRFVDKKCEDVVRRYFSHSLNDFDFYDVLNLISTVHNVDIVVRNDELYFDKDEDDSIYTYVYETLRDVDISNHSVEYVLCKYFNFIDNEGDANAVVYIILSMCDYKLERKGSSYYFVKKEGSVRNG